MTSVGTSPSETGPATGASTAGIAWAVLELLTSCALGVGPFLVYQEGALVHLEASMTQGQVGIGRSEEARKRGEMLQKDGAVTQIFGNHLFIQGRVEDETGTFRTSPWYRTMSAPRNTPE